MNENVEWRRTSEVGARIRQVSGLNHRIRIGVLLPNRRPRPADPRPDRDRQGSGRTRRKIASALGVRLEVSLVAGAGSGSAPAGRSPAKLRKLLAPLFWDRKLQPADLTRYPDWVLERVLMFGNRDQASAARRFYGGGAVIKAVGRKGVDPKTRNFWNIVLEGATVASEGSQ